MQTFLWLNMPRYACGGIWHIMDGIVLKLSAALDISAPKDYNIPMKRVTLYTDGACSGNPGAGGWGAVLLYGEHRTELSGGERETTNNRMELTAVIEGLKKLKYPCEVDVFSDSAYTVNGFSENWVYAWERSGWKKQDNKPVLNDDLWKELLALTRIHTVRFHKVKGHADDDLNNRCDALARAAIAALR